MEGTIVLEGIEDRIKRLGEASTKNPQMRRRINEVIRQTLRAVAANLRKDARSGLQMDSDPRNAYRAVRMAVYRRLFGGQVNILSSRKAHSMWLYEPPRTLQPGQRGGNRAKRSQRTTDLMSYQGVDRGFILRFLNGGTGDRAIHSMGDKSLNTGSVSILKTKGIGGNRGSIAARNWFGARSQQELENAAGNLDRFIDEILQGILL